MRPKAGRPCLWILIRTQREKLDGRGHPASRGRRSWNDLDPAQRRQSNLVVDGPTLGRFLRPEVLLTGRETTNHRWARGLHNAGFDTLSWPAIELVPAPDGSRLVAEAVERGSVLVFVSPGLISVVHPRHPVGAESSGTGPGQYGASTTQALQACGLTPSLEAQPARAEGLLPLLLERVPLGQEICILAGSRGRTWLQQQLQQSGRTVRQLVLYHNQAIPQPVRDHFTARSRVCESECCGSHGEQP